MSGLHPTRRTLLAGAAVTASLAASGAGTIVRPGIAEASTGNGPAMRTIPSSGEAIPAVGLGTWITFNVGRDPVLREASAAVMDAFFDAGGRLIDSSPMYGSAQAVVGYGLERLGRPDRVFSADKVWTSSVEDGPEQAEQSRAHWGVPQFDLLQVHNLVAWQAHLPMLQEMKAEGRLRYVGITTSHGRRHDLFEEIMRSEPLDFVQVTYNPVDREVERRILPLARDRGIAVIVNRPFRRGALTERLEGTPLPDWVAESGAATWAQAILKFILAHPAVTVAIPATTRPDHAVENVAAATAPLPDDAWRQRLSEHIRAS